MPRTSVRDTRSANTSRKVAAARAAVARSVGVLRARNARLRKRNTRTAGFLGIETKYEDRTTSTAILTGTGAASGECDPGTVNCLNAVAQGDTEQQRDGKNYLIRGLFIRGAVSWATAANLTQGRDLYPIFLAVVQDTQTNGAQLNSEDVFKNALASNIGNTMLMRNLQYSSRFKVLWTKWLQPQQPTVFFDGTNGEQFGWAVPFKVDLPNLDIRVECKGTSANVSDIVDNSLHFIALASSVDGTPTLNYFSRLRFVG